MKLPDLSDFYALTRELDLYAKLKAEYGAKGVNTTIATARKNLKQAIRELRALQDDKKLAEKEPNALPDIQKLRPKGPRRIWESLDASAYRDRLEGALLGRMAGCTLGAPVELWSIDKMKALAEELGEAFPPTDYWSRVPEPQSLRYEMSPREAYTREGMDGVPVDDDIVYTLLGLLILEDHGPDFTVEDVGSAWLKYLPYACTAEEVALNNLKRGIKASRCGSTNNPFCEWIGADIRADPWGYAAPGWPERAAALAYRDAFLSHRRQGIYGEMYFAAAISAAFTTDDPVDALEIGLTEIPRHCALAKAIRWAFNEAPQINNYRDARNAVEAKFDGYSHVHTLNNACLTVFGITIGRTDFTRVISETVAMGMDNDCTAATAGSIVGAVVGKAGIPENWHARFNNTVHSYLIGKKKFAISALLRRFEKQARRVYA